jgi:hypothetical protein
VPNSSLTNKDAATVMTPEPVPVEVPVLPISEKNAFGQQKPSIGLF